MESRKTLIAGCVLFLLFLGLYAVSQTNGWVYFMQPKEKSRQEGVLLSVKNNRIDSLYQQKQYDYFFLIRTTEDTLDKKSPQTFPPNTLILFSEKITLSSPLFSDALEMPESFFRALEEDTPFSKQLLAVDTVISQPNGENYYQLLRITSQ